MDEDVEVRLYLDAEYLARPFAAYALPATAGTPTRPGTLGRWGADEHGPYLAAPLATLCANPAVHQLPVALVRIALADGTAIARPSWVTALDAYRRCPP